MPKAQQAAAVQIVFCTCPDQKTGEVIATAAVDAGLAACVNLISGVVSTFRWQGKTCREQECLLVLKTTQDQLEALETCISTLHPYELPEIIAVPCTGGSGAYLDWVRKSVAAGKLKNI